MEPHRKSALLWGAVGALSFLALVQGYQLVTDATVTVPAMGGVALLVGAGAAVVAYWLEGRLGPVGAHPVDPDAEPGASETAPGAGGSGAGDATEAGDDRPTGGKEQS